MHRALAALLWLGAAGAFAQTEGDELGDTGAPPPSAEELGKTVEEPAAETPPPAPPRKKKSAEVVAGAGAPAAAASPGTSAAPNAETQQKIAKLEADLEAALRAEPGDARGLEALAGTWLPDGVVAGDARLRALVKLARGRALLMLRRYDESLDALTDARQAAETLPAQVQRPLVAQVKYRVAELEEQRGIEVERCGQALGLKRLAKLESEEAREHVEDAAQRYQVAVKLGDRFWGRRAAFRIAVLYEGFYRRGLEAKPGFRGISLPGPAAISRFDEAALVSELLYDRWPAEIARLYGEVIASIDASDPDPILLELARARATELGRLEQPAASPTQNPWFKDEHEGLLRYARRYEEKSRDLWLAVSAADAKPRLIEQLGRGPGTVDHAYALAALADAGPAPGTEEIAKALASADARSRVAGLFAAERHPDSALGESIIKGYLALSEPGRRLAFSSVASAMWGEAARSLLALRALADKNREIAEKLVGDTRLSAHDRAFIVAEVGDTRLQYALQSLANDRDANAAATALYALFVTRGPNARGLLRPAAEGVVGCVSRGIQRLDSGH